MSHAPHTDPEGLWVAARLLRQGRTLHGVSLVMSALAIVLVFVMGLAAPGLRMDVSTGCLLASVLAGVVQLYFALRVGFDADLFEAVAGQPSDISASRLDAGLQALRLQPPGKAGRPWAARLLGARGLLLRQAACTLVQLGLLLAAVLLV